MIAVIADDFTGAAEIGGIGLRRGMKVVIQTDIIHSTDADLLIIATDTRSLNAFQASEIMHRVTKEVLSLHPTLLYKKIDSVLRGNISAELKAQMDACGKKRAIVIAANPIFKRTIRNGIYYIDNIPLHKTSFSQDPEYPARSSSVSEVLGASVTTKLKATDPLPGRGIVVGDVTDEEDLKAWSSSIDEMTLPAGASGFFDELLSKNFPCNPSSDQLIPPFGETALYILGSAFPKDDGLFEKIGKNGHYVSNMPAEIYFNRDVNQQFFEKWVSDIVSGLLNHRKVVASVVHPLSSDPDISSRVRDVIGHLVKKVISKIGLNELIIEGGSTTSIVLKSLRINKLVPIQELETGVIRMQVEGDYSFYLTTKPGSYLWPEDVWLLQSSLEGNKIVHKK